MLLKECKAVQPRKKTIGQMPLSFSMSAPSPDALRIPLLGMGSRNARICVPKHMSTGTLKFVHVRMHGDTVVYSHTTERHSSKSQPLEMERASPSVSSQLLGVFSVSPQDRLSTEASEMAPAPNTCGKQYREKEHGAV